MMGKQPHNECRGSYRSRATAGPEGSHTVLLNIGDFQESEVARGAAAVRQDEGR
jgi:hypothetical protein